MTLRRGRTAVGAAFLLSAACAAHTGPPPPAAAAANRADPMSAIADRYVSLGLYFQTGRFLP